MTGGELELGKVESYKPRGFAGAREIARQSEELTELERSAVEAKQIKMEGKK